MFNASILGIISKFKKLSTDIEKFIEITAPKIDKARETIADMESNINTARKIKAKIDEVLG